MTFSYHHNWRDSVYHYLSLYHRHVTPNRYQQTSWYGSYRDIYVWYINTPVIFGVREAVVINQSLHQPTLDSFVTDPHVWTPGVWLLVYSNSNHHGFLPLLRFVLFFYLLPFNLNDTTTCSILYFCWLLLTNKEYLFHQVLGLALTADNTGQHASSTKTNGIRTTFLQRKFKTPAIPLPHTNNIPCTKTASLHQSYGHSK